MIKSDYKPIKLSNPIFSNKRKAPAAPIIMIVLALILILWGVSSTIFDSKEAETDLKSIVTEPADATSVSESKNFSIDLNLGDTEPENVTSQTSSVAKKQPKIITKSQPTIRWTTTKIKKGDSTARLFKRNNLSASDLYGIMQLGKKTDILKRIQAGHVFEYTLDAQKKLMGIRYHIDRLNTLEVLRRNNQWQAELLTKDVEVRHNSANGEIKDNLFLAGKNAGLTDAMVMELAGIFGWDIDFILDIRKGDRFTLIYEEKYVEGEKFGNGAILAAEFINQGKSFKAVRYEHRDGSAEYYTPDGFSMRKAFLRAPVDFSYISSNFKPKRFHPILRRVKAHNGVDYRAPKGTPVKSAGDGKVISAAYNKYNGHYVFIQHGQKYVTKYLHFTKRAVRKGQRVKQGQIIGYVGSTGLAEAPHLHYEFLVNGVHRNPRTVDLPDAEPVNKKERKRFFNNTAELLNQLKVHTNLLSDRAVIAD